MLGGNNGFMDGAALECVYTSGAVDLSRVDAVIPLVANQVVSVGRLHQVGFFEKLLPRKERLTAISRAHFELMWDANVANAVRLKKVSGNPLLLNNRPLANNEVALLQDGATISFSSASEGEDVRFLELCVALRSRTAVRNEGMHPANQTPPTPPPQRAPTPPQATLAAKAVGSWQAGTVAVLECTSAIGIDVTTLPLAERVIELPLHSMVEIGKQKQPGFFTRLLEAEPKWLSFISRTHCRVQLTCPTFPSRADMALSIENISVNCVVVSERKVPKGSSECIQEGGTFAFVAAPDGPKEIKFLEFVLRGV